MRRVLQLVLLAGLVTAALLWRMHPQALAPIPRAPDETLVRATLDLIHRYYITEPDEARLFIAAGESIANGVLFLQEEQRRKSLTANGDTEPAPEPTATPEIKDPDTTPTPAPGPTPEPEPFASAKSDESDPNRVILTVDGRAKDLDFSGNRDQNIDRLLAGISFAAHEAHIMDQRELLYFVLGGMLAGLDPHSGFIDPEKAKRFFEDTQGFFSGIGIEIGIRDKKLTVISPIEGTPAFEAGLQADDWIKAVDGLTTQYMTLYDAVDVIRGPRGTPVVLTIVRQDVPEPFDVPIVRDKIQVESVKLEMMEDNVAYIRLRNFSKTTGHELVQALEKIKTQTPNVAGLVLDLRNNHGGLLDAAVAVTDAFVDSGPIVSTKGRGDDNKKAVQAVASNTFTDLPVIVLTNSGSASASEIVSGALQDHGRALILGGTTFGKGSVQSIIDVDGSSYVALTTQKYYTPSGRSIQASGIVPDIQLYYMTTDGEVVDRLVSEEDLEGFLPNDSPHQHQATMRVDAEKLYWFYRNQNRVPEELGPDDPDALMVLAHDLLTSQADPTIGSMLQNAETLVEQIQQILVPETDEELRPAA